MKKILICCLTLGMLFSCAESEEPADEQIEEVAQDDDRTALVPTDNPLADFDPRTYGGAKSEDQIAIEEQLAQMKSDDNALTACWVGMFGDNMINLTISTVGDGMAQGYSVCAGNFRPITGTCTEAPGNTVAFEMKEPGDDQYDGVFNFTINPDSNQLVGYWEPYKAEGNTPKSYLLESREYQYNPESGSYTQASTKLMSEEEVSYYDPYELAYMRNSVYARHGYSFKNKEWRYQFENEDWYMPMGVDLRDKITDIEAENIKIIYRYEAYYEENYDDWGR